MSTIQDYLNADADRHIADSRIKIRKFLKLTLLVLVLYISVGLLL